MYSNSYFNKINRTWKKFVTKMQCISHKRDNQTNFAILQHETNDNKCNFDSKETKFGYILKIYFLSFAIHMRSKLTLIHCGPIFFF